MLYSLVLSSAGVDADLIVYVVAKTAGCDSNDDSGSIEKSVVLAYANGCLQDPMNNRPVAGMITFCTFGPNQLDEDLETAVHEIIHVLVRAPFSSEISVSSPQKMFIFII